MPEDELSRVFSALADPTRRDIVSRLAVGDATVGELAAPYDVSIQAVSKHLKVLEDAGLVSRSRDAQRRPCHLEAEVFDLMTKWIERYRREAEERYRRLDTVLAEMDDVSTDRARRSSETNEGSSIMTTTTKHETTIEADPTLPDRHDHPRLRRAARPRLPRPHRSRAHRTMARARRTPTMRIDRWDAETGGSYRYAALTDGAEIATFYGSFHEVRPSERIVQTFTWEGMPDGVALETLTFEDIGEAGPVSPPPWWSTRSRRATRSCPAAWRSASTRATTSSTPSSR